MYITENVTLPTYQCCFNVVDQRWNNVYTRVKIMLIQRWCQSLKQR